MWFWIYLLKQSIYSSCQLVSSLAAGRPHVALMTVIKLLCFPTLESPRLPPALQQDLSIAGDCGSSPEREAKECRNLPAWNGGTVLPRLISLKTLCWKQLATRPISEAL